MNDPACLLLVSTQGIKPAPLDRRFDRLVVDLIEIDDHTAFQIRLLTKRHVHETEGLKVHCSWFSCLVFESGWDCAGSFAASASAAARKRSSSPTVIFESGLIVRSGPRRKNHRPKRDQ